jgi:pimeloyl-ACP methyl ester carboxylesterase
MSIGNYVMVNGHSMYYEQYGVGRPIVLLHGGLHTIHLTFEQQIAAFAEQHQVIAIEQVGHGHSADRQGPFSYADMAEDTAALLRQLNITSADFVGWSDGGILSLMLVRRYPALVRRLAISGANPQAQCCILPGIDHNTFQKASTWLNPIILAFLDAP